MILRGPRIFGFLGLVAASVICAPGFAQDVPAGAVVLKEIDVGSGFGELGVVQSDGDDAAELPLGLAAMPGEGLVILDNVNNRLIRVSFDGSQLSVRNSLPPDSNPLDIAARSGELYILDGQNARVIQPGRTGGRSLGSGGRTFGRSDFGNFVGLDDAGVPATLPPSGAGGRSFGGPAGDLSRRSPTQFNYNEQFRPQGRGLTMTPRSGGRSFERPDSPGDFAVVPTAETHEGIDVVTARIIWQSKDVRTSDVYVEEMDSAADGISLRTAIRRYERPQGQQTSRMVLTAIAPLAEARRGGNPVASDGTHVFQLQPVLSENRQVTKFRLLKIKFLPVAPPRRRPDPVRTVETEPGPTIPAAAQKWPPFGRGALESQSEARQRRDNFCARVTGDEGTQSAVLAKVRAAGDAFTTMTWKVNASTMGRSSCDRGGDWARAVQLNSAKAGDTATGMPYGWGNFDSVEGFKRKVEQDGVRGGSVCTKAQVISNTAGIDCSGFVHKALGLESRGKLSTVSMQSHMIDLRSYSALRPGDVLLDPGSHVMFFLGAENGGVRTIESTKGCKGPKFQGVCYNFRRYSEVADYRPARPATNCTK